MTNKSDQKQQKITPASHGDELDVLEAIYKIEESKEKKLLSSKQLKTLIDSGRIKEGAAEARSNDYEVGADDLVISVVEDAVVEVLIKNSVYTREQWDKKNERLKTNLLRAYAFAMLGVDLEDWALKMRQTIRS